jgi:transketolase
MLHEAIGAAEILRQNDFHLKVVNMPWLNRIDPQWLEHTITPFDAIYVLEDHAPIGGLGDWLLNFLVDAQLLGTKHFLKLAVEGYPAWGTPTEVLQYHGLDSASIAKKIFQNTTDV